MTDYMQAALDGITRAAPEFSNDDARFFGATHEEIAESVMNSVLDAQAEALGIKGWWIDIDGHGELTVWRPGSIAVTRQWGETAEVWAILAALIPEKIVNTALVLTCAWRGCGRGYGLEDDDADEIFCSEKCRRPATDDNERTSMAAEFDPCEDAEEPS